VLFRRARVAVAAPLRHGPVTILLQDVAGEFSSRSGTLPELRKIRMRRWKW
jgi:hypothetical protein